VTVSNRDGATHTFSSVSGPSAFDTGPLDAGSSAQVTFPKSGSYAYHCKIHSSMTGTITVG
jgi:plastocyanin